MRKLLLTFILFFGISPHLIAQEMGNKEPEKMKHTLTLGFGYTFIPKATSLDGTEPNGILVPSIGLDYFYRIAPKWEVGTMIELELGDYLIFEKNLSREKAMVIAVLGAYKITERINLFGGGGIELEKHHNLVVLRMGTEYLFKFNNDWVLAPGFFYNFKEGYDTWSIALAFGKEF